MGSFGISEFPVQVGMAATIAIETGKFLPIEEGRAKNPDSELFKKQAKYWKHKGRGYIQLTHERNYRSVGIAIGVDLIANPALALDPWIGAKIAAHYFKSHIVSPQDRRFLYQACMDADWEAIRRGVNGPKYYEDQATLQKFKGYCTALAATEGKIG
jgi:predicted chitinase